MARKNRKIASNASKLKFENLSPEEQERVKDAVTHSTGVGSSESSEEDDHHSHNHSHNDSHSHDHSHESDFEVEYEIASQILANRSGETRTVDHYYVPVIFHVAFPEGEYPSDSVQEDVRADIDAMIARWNSALRDGNIGPDTDNTFWEIP